MGDVANQDEAIRCLGIAEANLASGNLDKAHRFAEKAMKLFPNDQARSPLQPPAPPAPTPASSPSSPR